MELAWAMPLTLVNRCWARCSGGAPAMTRWAAVVSAVRRRSSARSSRRTSRTTAAGASPLTVYACHRFFSSVWRAISCAMRRASTCNCWAAAGGGCQGRNGNAPTAAHRTPAIVRSVRVRGWVARAKAATVRGLATITSTPGCAAKNRVTSR